MATPISPTIPGFEPDERANCRVVEYTSPDPDVLLLPTLVLNETGEVISRWKLSQQERLQAYLTGDIYVRMHTFGNLLQPLLVHADPPAMLNAEGDNKPEAEVPPTGHVPQFGVLFDILQERARMDEVGGLKRYSPELWLAILSKQTGQTATAVINQTAFKSEHPELRRELVQVAAVALAWLEAIDDPEGTGEPLTLGLSGEADDVLRRLVKSAGAASVIHSLSKAARSESLNLMVTLENLGYEHQARMEARPQGEKS